MKSSPLCAQIKCELKLIESLRSFAQLCEGGYCHLWERWFNKKSEALGAALGLEGTRDNFGAARAPV